MQPRGKSANGLKSTLQRADDAVRAVELTCTSHALPLVLSKLQDIIQGLRSVYPDPRANQGFRRAPASVFVSLDHRYHSTLARLSASGSDVPWNLLLVRCCSEACKGRENFA